MYRADSEAQAMFVVRHKPSWQAGYRARPTHPCRLLGSFPNPLGKLKNEFSVKPGVAGLL